MVMGERIKPGTVPAAAKIKETADKAPGEQNSESGGRARQVKPAGDPAGAAARDTNSRRIPVQESPVTRVVRIRADGPGGSSPDS